MTSRTKQNAITKHHLDDDADCHQEHTQAVDREMQRVMEQEIADLEIRLADLEARLPAHSIPQAMIIEMDELEQQLIEARARLASLQQLANS
jgi:protein subunit release factor A